MTIAKVTQIIPEVLTTAASSATDLKVTQLTPEVLTTASAANTHLKVTQVSVELLWQPKPPTILQSSEIDTALGFTPKQIYTINQSVEVDTSLEMTPPLSHKISQAVESDVAIEITTPGKLGQSLSTESALPFTSPIVVIKQAVEVDTAAKVKAITIEDAKFTSWLSDDSGIRCILVEAIVNIASVETTLYFSNTGYVTKGTDTPSNLDYLPIIVGGAEITESISLDSQAGLSFGDIELSNIDGVYDDYLDYVWVNREVKVYIGDVRWDRSDFRTVFDGVISDINISSTTSFSLEFRDKLQRLNSPVIEDTLGGTTVNKDKILPVCFGECFNVTPLLTDDATHEYQVHNGSIEDIIEVRDNGVPVSITKYLANGKFTLNQNSNGVITCSVQGDNIYGYKTNIADIVYEIATRYGKSSLRFISDDVDTVNLSDFTIANPDCVGGYYSDRSNVITVINDFAKSLNAQAVMSREGKLRLLRIELPPDGVATNLTTDDINEKSLKIVGRTDVVSSIKLGYCKNYTLQQNLQTGIPESSSALFNDVWVDRLQTDATTETLYKLDAEPVRRETQLIVESEVDTESQRLLDLFKTPRTIYGFSGGIHLIELELGGRVNLTHPRYGLDAGVDGMIIKIQVNWFTRIVNVEVIV